MSLITFYGICGVVLFVLGLYSLIMQANLMLKVIAINIMGSGCFLYLIALARHSDGVTDSVPHAMVITGIVVAVSATALALALINKLITSGDHQQHSGLDE